MSSAQLLARSRDAGGGLGHLMSHSTTVPRSAPVEPDNVLDPRGVLMAQERQVEEAIARFLSILGRYHDGERSEWAKEVLVAEVATVVGWLQQVGMTPTDTEEHIVIRMRVTLRDRYGHEVGKRINHDFLACLDQAWAETDGHDNSR